MLPRSRNRTYGDGSPVIPGDLDDLQDGEIGAKHGLVTLWKTPTVASVTTNITLIDGSLRWQTNADAAILGGFEVGEFLEGTTIVGGRVRLFGTAAAGDIQVNVELNKADGTSALLLSATVHNPGAAWALFDLALAVPYQPGGHVMLAGETLSGDITFAKNTSRFGAIGIQIARD